MWTKLVVAQGHTMIRQGLIALLKQERDMEVLGEAKDGPEAVKACRELRPNLVIMVGTELNGVDTTREILSRWRDIQILAVSLDRDRRRVNEMLEAGASGYILMDSPVDELAEAVRAVRCGRTFLSPSIEKIVGSGRLSARGREVLQLLAEGKSTKEIAARLRVSVKTIEVNSHRAREKLGLHSMAEVTKWALGEGLTSFDQASADSSFCV